MEHRCGQRFRLNAPASVTDGSQWTAVARVRDISASGAFLECSAPHATVTRVLVRLRGGSVEIAGDVIRRTREGIGIEWGEFAPVAVAPLLRARVDGARAPAFASQPQGARGSDRRLPRAPSQPRTLERSTRYPPRS